MKVLYTLSLMSALCMGFASVGCEQSHSEKDSTNMLGQHTHEDTTVTKNPVTGDTSVQHSEQKN